MRHFTASTCAAVVDRWLFGTSQTFPSVCVKRLNAHVHHRQIEGTVLDVSETLEVGMEEARKIVLRLPMLVGAGAGGDEWQCKERRLQYAGPGCVDTCCGVTLKQRSH